MVDERYTVSSPKAIEGLIEAWSPFTPASRALGGLTAEQAATKLDGRAGRRRVGAPSAISARWRRAPAATPNT
jgi:hypothetical protein